MKGLTTYQTKDGVRVARLHYSADPDKDPETEQGAKWIASQLRGYPGGMAGVKWRREMEIDFTLRGSSRVFPEWAEMIPKITCVPFEVPEHWPIWGGYDYGNREPFAFVAVAFESLEKCYQIDEIYQSGLSAPQQAQLIRERSYFKRLQGIVGDPSIWRKDQNQSGGYTLSIGDILKDNDVFVEKGRNEVGVDIVYRDLLKGTLWKNLDAPRFIIFDSCKNTLREFRNLTHTEWASSGVASRRDLPESIVSKHTNAWDGLKYLMLSQMHIEPGDAPLVPNTFMWYRKKMADLRRRRERLIA